MRAVTFFEGAFVALLLAFLASMGFAVLSSIFPQGLALRLSITSLATIYVAYLLVRSNERIGRLTVAIGWLIACGLLIIVYPSATTHLVVLAGLIWIVRSLFCYASVVCAFADLALTAAAIVAALWAASETHSVAIATWCFFLVQAIFIRIPRSLDQSIDDRNDGSDTQDHFAQSLSVAETAAKKLITQ